MSSLNYAEIIDKARRTQPEHAANARAPVFYEAMAKKRTRNVKKRAKLTTPAKQASLTKARDTVTHTGRRRKNPPGAPTMAKKKRSAAQVAAQKKASRAAKRARKAKTAPVTHVKTPRKAARKSSKKGKRKAKRRTATRRAVAIRVPPSRKTKSGRRTRRSVTITVKGAKRKRSRRLRLPRKTRQVYVIAAERRRKRSRKTPRRHRAGERRHKSHKARKGHRHGGRRRGAMENPLTGTELFVGGIFGLVGFGLGDVADRFIATHPITLKSAATATTPALYADTPPTSGQYVGLFNPTAITAPMNLARWANALGVPAVLFGVAYLVKGPTVRSAVQFAAFGYGLRTIGKGMIDGVAKLLGNMQVGQRFFDGELRAQVLAANNGNQQAAALGNLPAAGLGNPGCACGGKCVKCAPGVGWPSMPRELPASSNPPPVQTSAPQMQTQQPRTVAPAAPPPSAIPAAPPPPPPGASTSGLTGAPRRSSVYGGYEH